MKAVFHPDAEKEFLEAIAYYEERQENLGYDFALEVHNAIQRALDFPETWPKLRDEVRRSLVRRFPFGLLYSVEEDHIFLIAVMHLHKHPDYWSNMV